MALMEKLSKSSLFVYGSVLVLYTIGLWGFSIPLTGDQKVYLSIALEMRERGSWLIPYLNGLPNFLKPPLEYWATLLGWKIFGFNLFGALFPSVLAMMGSAFWVNKIAAFFKGSKQLLPGFFFASALGTVTYATTAQMEIWIVLFYLWSWHEFLKNRYFSAFLLVGVMAWIKGPLYPVLWVMSTGLWFFLHERGKTVFSKRYLSALGLGILVGLAWYVLAAQREFHSMLNEFLFRENMSKMHVTQGNPFRLWLAFFYSLFPWFFLLMMALSQQTGREWVKTQGKFFLAFGLIPALFFTFFPYRVNTYLYLLTPVAAWMVGCLETSQWGQNKFTHAISWLMTLSFFLLFPVVFRLWNGGWIGLELMIPMIMVLVLFIYYSWSRRVFPIAVLSLLLVSLVRMGAVEMGEKDIQGLRSFQETHPVKLAYFVEDQDIWHEFGLVSAAIGEPISRLHTEDQRLAFIEAGGALIYQDQQVIPAGLNCVNWARMKKRLKFPLKAFITEGLAYGNPDLIRNFKICMKDKAAALVK